MGLFSKKKKEQKVKWEPLFEGFGEYDIWRAKVPGGWLVRTAGNNGVGITFFPDADHEWDGRTLEHEGAE